jgi:hypothetical protein
MKKYLFAIMLGCLAGGTYAAAVPAASHLKQKPVDESQQPVLLKGQQRVDWNSPDDAARVRSWSI